MSDALSSVYGFDSLRHSLTTLLLFLMPAALASTGAAAQCQRVSRFAHESAGMERRSRLHLIARAGNNVGHCGGPKGRATYFDIDYRGKIQPPNPDPDLFLTQEARLASLITRNPTRAQIDAVCTKPSISGETCNQDIKVIIDGRFRNIASLKTRGVDTVLDYFLNTARGKVTFSLNGTYTIDQRQQITPTAPVFDLVNTVGNTTSLRLVGILSWSLKGWTVQSTVNYTGAYRDPASVPERRVDSWTTVDINVGYRVDGGSGWLANTQFNLGINNALDQRPPFVNQFDLTSGTFGYDPANASLLGRQVSLQLVKRWGQ